MKRLSKPTGEIADNQIREGDSEEKIIRPAILVHAGSEGQEITFQSGDGEITFDTDRIKRIVENQNKLIGDLAEQYGGIEKMPIGAYPPILDQHEGDSSNRVLGRLASKLRFEVRDVPKVGKNVPCAVADIVWLGSDAVKKVQDGRIYHLSIGIDETTDTLGETSAVIEPAAPGAMLLNKKKSVIKEKQGASKMSKKRLEAHKSRLKQLGAIKKSLTEMSQKLVKSSEKVELQKKEVGVVSRLSACMKAGKITPAEFKKIQFKKLAALPEESLNTVIETYEALEPKVLIGQRGTSSAIEFSSMAKSLEKKQFKSLKSEIKADFKRLGKKLASDEDETEMEVPEFPSKEENEEKKMAFEDVAEKDSKLKAHLAKVEECLAAGDVDGAKDAHKALAAEIGEKEEKHLEISDVKSEDYKNGMEDLQKELNEVKTQMSRMAGMIDKLYSAEKEEGHDLEVEGEEDKKLEGEEEKDLEGEIHVDIDSHKGEEEEKELSAEEEEKKLSAEEEEKKLASEEEEKKELGAEDLKEEAKKDMKKMKKNKKDGEKA